MKAPTEKVVQYALGKVLRPLIRFCLRRSIKIQDVVSVIKREFVSVAREELEAKQLEESVSKISVMTGLQRADVSRVVKQKEEDPAGKASVIGKVISQWRHDKRFTTKNGEPRELICKGKTSEFAQLVQSVSKYINPYTVFFELERLGYIEQPHTSAGRIPTDKGYRLYVNQTSESGDVEPSSRGELALTARIGEGSVPERAIRNTVDTLVELTHNLGMATIGKQLYMSGLSNLFGQPEFMHPG